jgi:hypothetical protein
MSIHSWINTGRLKYATGALMVYSDAHSNSGAGRDATSARLEMCVERRRVRIVYDIFLPGTI